MEGVSDPSYVVTSALPSSLTLAFLCPIGMLTHTSTAYISSGVSTQFTHSKMEILTGNFSLCIYAETGQGSSRYTSINTEVWVHMSKLSLNPTEMWMRTLNAWGCHFQTCISEKRTHFPLLMVQVLVPLSKAWKPNETSCKEVTPAFATTSAFTSSVGACSWKWAGVPSLYMHESI